MRNRLSALGLSVLCSAALANHEPSDNAAALEVLRQGGVLCYSADVTVDDETDAALNRQAEAIMIKTLNGLYLKATQYDAAETCDRELLFTFQLDVDGAPTLYNDDLKLHSYVATDGDVELDSVTVWSNGFWGGDGKVLSRAAYTKKMQEHLVAMLAQFTTDYRSLGK